jgi:hypothetical protein
VRLTPAGRSAFLRMAEAHEAWLAEMFEGFEPLRKDALFDLLGGLRVHLAQREAEGHEAPKAPLPAPRSTGSHTERHTGRRPPTPKETT